jgi:hypothetical protein
MQPLIDAMPEGSDKDTMQLLVTSQDTLERDDAHPRDRARAARRLAQLTGPRVGRPAPANGQSGAGQNGTGGNSGQQGNGQQNHPGKAVGKA